MLARVTWSDGGRRRLYVVVWRLDLNASNLTLPRGDVRYAGPARPFGWRTEHQGIALQCEKTPLIRADEVRIGAALDMMRHGSGSLIPVYLPK